jgi:hypothetical protein
LAWRHYEGETYDEDETVCRRRGAFDRDRIAGPCAGLDVPARPVTQEYNYSNRDDGYRDRGFWPGDVAAGIVGGAVGTADAMARAPFRNSCDARNSYARANGFVCQPGTWFRGEDGRRHICQ